MSQRHPKPSVPYMEFLSSLYPQLPPGSRLWVTEMSTRLEKPELEILHHSHAGPSPHSNLTFELSLGSVTSLYVHASFPGQLPARLAFEPVCLCALLHIHSLLHAAPRGSVQGKGHCLLTVLRMKVKITGMAYRS